MSTAQAAYTAIVIDDDRGILNLVGDLLAEAGFTTTCFSRGQPALATLRSRRADLLVVDLMLPDINGLSICNEVRDQYGDDVAIMVITADDRRQRHIAALSLGADDVVPKPFDIDELQARIETHFRRTLGRRADDGPPAAQP